MPCSVTMQCRMVHVRLSSTKQIVCADASDVIATPLLRVTKVTSPTSVILLYSLLGKRRKVASLVQLVPQIRLSEHSQCVSRYLATNARP
jgi:hypothetical protein